MVDTLLIASSGRSGSTLLDLMLGAHPSAMALGEITQLPRDLAENNTCSCGTPVRTCTFWERTVGVLEDRLGLDLHREPFSLELGWICNPKKRYIGPVTARYEREWKLRHGLHYLLETLDLADLVPARDRFAQGVSNTLELFGAVREVGGCTHVVDSSKIYLKLLALYRSNPSGTRILLLTRDGRASFYSRLRDGYDREDSVKAWRNYYQRLLPLLERHVTPEHVCRIRYEDLMADPAGELERICESCGLEFDPAMLDIHGRVHHITSGNDMRLTPTRAIRVDTTWQDALKPGDRDYFETHAGELNRSLGYN